MLTESWNQVQPTFNRPPVSSTSGCGVFDELCLGRERETIYKLNKFHELNVYLGLSSMADWDSQSKLYL